MLMSPFIRTSQEDTLWIGDVKGDRGELLPAA